MKSKLAKELKLIALLAFGIPTLSWLVTVGLWWECEPIKVFAGYLLSVIGLAALCVAISLYDEYQKAKEKECSR